MRTGVNAGSLERDLLERYGEPCPEAAVESTLNHARSSKGVAAYRSRSRSRVVYGII